MFWVPVSALIFGISFGSPSCVVAQPSPWDPSSLPCCKFILKNVFFRAIGFKIN